MVKRPSSPALGTAPTFDEDQIRATFDRLVVDPATECAEVRILDAGYDGRAIVPVDDFRKTIAGYFNDADALVNEVRRARGISVYICSNPAPYALLARACNRMKTSKSTTKDVEVACILHLFLDVDPRRPDGIPSTDEQQARALALADRILAENPGLRPAASVGTSGNGAMILVRLPDYPNDEEHRELLATAVDAFHARYGDAAAEVDEKAKNAARVLALPGTLKCKGDAIPGLPHRWPGSTSGPSRRRPST
jgi:hypothetical protein